MNHKVLIITTGLFFLFSAQVVCGQQSEQQSSFEAQKDSLRNLISQTEGKDKLRAYTQLSYLYMAEVGDDRKMDTLLVVFDEIEKEARKQGDLSQQGMVRGNRIVAFENKGMYDEAIRIAPETLEFLADNELWRFYYIVFSVVTDSYSNKGDYNGAISGAKQVYELAKERSDKEGMAVAHYAMANVYNHQKRWADMETNLRECIALLYSSDLYLNILTQSYTFLTYALRMLDRYDEALQILPEFEQAVRRYDEYTATTQHEAWGNYYTACMKIYLDMGEYDEAETWLSKLEESGANQQVSQYDILEAKAKILKSHKKYEEALIKIDSAMLVVGNQAIFTQNQLMQTKMGILIQMGSKDEAEQLFHDFVAVQDSIFDMEVNAQLDEIRIQYEVDRYIAEKERNRTYFLFSLGGCLLLIVALTIWITYSRRLQKKNANLVKQILQQDKLYDEAKADQSELERLRSIVQESSKIHEDEEEQDDELFNRLCLYMSEQQPYTSSELNRKKIADALNTNEKYLRNTIKKNADTTVNDFIMLYRLKHANKLLLLPSKEYTIEAVAIDSGFGSRGLFYKYYRDHYGLTPSEFRRIARKNEDLKKVTS